MNQVTRFPYNRPNTDSRPAGTGRPGRPVRVMIAIRDQLVHLGMQQLLLGISRVQLVTTRSEADIVLVDDDWLGAPTTPAEGHRPAHMVIFLSGRPVDVLQALEAGVNGCLDRNLDVRRLTAAIELVRDGGVYVAPSLFPPLRQAVHRLRHRQDPGRGLTPRELDTLRLMAMGCTYRQIAQRLELTETTVNTYIKRIRLKLGGGNAAELTRKAVALNYLPTELQEWDDLVGCSPRADAG
jgi:DNA-binding NarL/FixJ family response regulator